VSTAHASACPKALTTTSSLVEELLHTASSQDGISLKEASASSLFRYLKTARVLPQVIKIFRFALLFSVNWLEAAVPTTILLVSLYHCSSAAAKPFHEAPVARHALYRTGSRTTRT